MMCSTSVISISFLVSLIYFHPDRVLGQVQVLQLFQGLNCEGARDAVVESRVPVFPCGGSTTIYYRSYSVFGMWQIGYCTGQTAQACSTGVVSVRVLAQNQVTCYNVENAAGPAITAFDVKRIGDQSMILQELHLYDRPNFENSSSVTIIDSKGRSNVERSTVGSYFFAGNNEWAMYDQPGYAGRKVCIRPDQDVARKGYGITYAFNANLVVRSVRYGCNAGMRSFIPSIGILAVSIILLTFQ